MKVGNVLRDRDDGFLNDILRFGIVEAGLPRDAVNEPPISIEELAPAGMVIPGSEALK